MAYYNKLVKQTSLYLAGHLLLGIAGLLSFPIWTRALTTSEYGTLNLLNLSVFFLTALSKSGLQKAVIRFFVEISNNRRAEDVQSFYTTHVIATVVSSILLNGLFILIVYNSGFKLEDQYSLLFLIALVISLAFVEALSSILFSFLRVEQRVKQNVLISLCNRYGGIVLSIFLLLVIKMGLLGIVLGQLIASSLVVMMLLGLFLSEKKLRFSSFSVKYLKEAFGYGLPLIPAESSRLILELGDRYLIQFFLGAAAVGVYSAGYNITTHIRRLISLPVNQAIQPLYLEIYAKKGMGETKKFLEMVINYYLIVLIPLIFILSYFSKEIIVLVASERYYEAAPIIPLIIAPILIYGFCSVYGAGLLIFKKTKLFMNLSLLAALMNLGLNFWLIPSFGIIGAAIATNVSYVVLIVSIGFLGFRYLPLSINYGSALRSLIGSCLMLQGFRLLTLDFTGGFVAKVGIGVIFYIFWVTLFDAKLREKMKLILCVIR